MGLYYTGVTPALAVLLQCYSSVTGANVVACCYCCPYVIVQSLMLPRLAASGAVGWLLQAAGCCYCLSLLCLLLLLVLLLLLLLFLLVMLPLLMLLLLFL